MITLCDVLSKTQGKDFQQVLNLVGRKRPYFSPDENLLRVGQKIEGTNIFFETNLSANSIVKLSYDVISLFGYSKKDLQISAD